MTNRRSTAFAALVLVLSLGSWAFAAESDVIREAQDRADIEQLMWRYVRALDTYNAEAYAAAFAPDGQFGAGANATKGREALKKMITDLHQRQADNTAKTGVKPAPMYHVLTNSYVEFIDKDHARPQAYWMTVFGSAGENAPTRVAAAGREVDELVRLNGHWLIRLRDVAPKD
jgi:SnoaL-like domain